MNTLTLESIKTLDEAVFMTVSSHNGDEYINVHNGTMKNKEYLFNQDFEVYYSQVDNDIIITNHSLDGQNFYDFQDENTFQVNELYEALIAFIKHINTPDCTPSHEIKTEFNNEYMCLYRPFGIGTFPRVEVVSVDDCNKTKDGCHSIVKTKEPLNDQDIKSFELKKLYR